LPACTYASNGQCSTQSRRFATEAEKDYSCPGVRLVLSDIDLTGVAMKKVIFPWLTAILCGTASICAVAQTQSSQTTAPVERPSDTKQTAARFVNVNVQGNLAPTRQLQCLNLLDAKSSYTPADLHTSIRQCLGIGAFDRAARLFALAGVYARFDAERVADPTARDAGQMLILQTFTSITPEAKKKFGQVYMAMVKDPATHAQLCSDVLKIGPPSYFPTYMVAHGMNAVMGKFNDTDALVPDFNASEAWKSLQSTYLMCGKLGA
jgi:hypothetical protein